MGSLFPDPPGGPMLCPFFPSIWLELGQAHRQRNWGPLGFSLKENLLGPVMSSEES